MELISIDWLISVKSDTNYTIQVPQIVLLKYNNNAENIGYSDLKCYFDKENVILEYRGTELSYQSTINDTIHVSKYVFLKNSSL